MTPCRTSCEVKRSLNKNMWFSPTKNGAGRKTKKKIIKIPCCWTQINPINFTPRTQKRFLKQCTRTHICVQASSVVVPPSIPFNAENVRETTFLRFVEDLDQFSDNNRNLLPSSDNVQFPCPFTCEYIHGTPSENKLLFAPLATQRTTGYPMYRYRGVNRSGYRFVEEPSEYPKNTVTDKRPDRGYCSFIEKPTTCCRHTVVDGSLSDVFRFHTLYLATVTGICILSLVTSLYIHTYTYINNSEKIQTEKKSYFYFGPRSLFHFSSLGNHGEISSSLCLSPFRLIQVSG